MRAFLIQESKKFQTVRALHANLKIVAKIAPVECEPLLESCVAAQQDWSSEDFDAFGEQLLILHGRLHDALEGARTIKRQLSPKLGVNPLGS